jgi:NAD(P)-dependent dehydrogenase (short-subunit alcohol dehydrogenase family)
VTDPDAVAAAVAAAPREGDLSICVCSAGINRTGPSDRLELADWDLVLDTNLRLGRVVSR